MTLWTRVWTNRELYTKTALILSGYMAIATMTGTLGPTLLDFRQQVQTDMTTISFTTTARAAGHGIGSVIMGVIYAKMNFPIFSVLFMILTCVLTIATPLATNVPQIMAIFLIGQLVMGAFDVGCNTYMIQLWGKGSPPFLHAMQSVFGIGALAGSLIVGPFLYEDGTIVHSTFSNDTSSGDTEVFHPEKIDLRTPFFILAANFAVNGLLWIPFCFSSAPKEKSDHEKGAEDGNGSGEDGGTATLPESSDRVSKGLVIVFSMFFMHMYMGAELSMGTFLAPFVVQSDLKQTAETGSEVTSLFFLGYTFTRVLTVFYVRFIGDELNIAGCLTVILIGNSVLFHSGDRDMRAVWLGVTLMGVGASSIWGSLFGYLNNEMTLSSQVTSALIVSAVLGEFTFPAIIATFMQDYPRILLDVSLATAVGMIASFAIVVLICKRRMRQRSPSATAD